MAKQTPKYTCVEYRQEMILLGLRQRLANEKLTEKDRLELLREIQELQAFLKMD